MISKAELLQGRDKTFKDEYTQQISDNLDDLLVVLNKLRAAYNKPMTVTSGWRPASINGMINGAAPKSNHITGNACDFADKDGSLFNWCLANLQLLKDLGLYLEDPKWTKNWLHVQNTKPSSGKIIYTPSSALPTNPTAWSGIYDSRFDSKPIKK